jgi:hypothetical protein
MAITVGTDSYVSLANARAYLAKVGKSLPSTDSVAEDLLKQATLAIDRIFADRFIGVRISSNPLEWPRLADYVGPGGVNIGGAGGYGYSNTGRYLEPIPREVEQATSELAVLLDEGLNPYTQPEAAVMDSSITVDVISISTKASGARVDDPIFNVSLILRPVLITGSGLRLVR